jgi:uncharacterized membrane protein YozB (DUF420 family)
LKSLLGTRADGWLDAGALGLTVLTGLLLLSVVAVRRGRFRLHRRLQMILAGVALVMVLLLEWRFRTVGWREAAKSSSWFPLGVDLSLGIHIAFALAMVVGWIGAVTVGIRGWRDGSLDVDQRARHRWWGWFATIATIGTAVTAWIFYVAAFML